MNTEEKARWSGLPERSLAISECRPIRIGNCGFGPRGEIEREFGWFYVCLRGGQAGEPF